MNELQKLNKASKLPLNPWFNMIKEILIKDGSLCVTDIQIKMRENNQPVTSQYLKQMKDLGYVKDTRKGKKIYYSFNHLAYAEICDEMIKALKKRKVFHDLYITKGYVSPTKKANKEIRSEEPVV